MAQLLAKGTRAITQASKNSKEELPEYVALGGEYGSYEWVPAHTDFFDRGGIDLYRARVDIILIVDGKVVDLNRLQMPADTPIIDNRFRKGITSRSRKP